MRETLLAIPGVASAEVSCITGRATCRVAAGVDVKALAAAVTELGFETELDRVEAAPSE